MKTLLLSSLAASVSLGMVTACSVDTSNERSSGTARPTIMAAPTFKSLSNSGLPLDAYMMTGQQLREWTNARQLLTRDCMKRFGIKWDFRRLDKPFPDYADQSISFWPITKVRQYGYQVPTGSGMTDKNMSTPLTDEQTKVFNGIDGSISASGKDKKATVYNGVGIPEGGCQGEANRSLGINGTENVLDSRTQSLRAEAIKRANTDPQTDRVIAAWSACMKRAGHDYKTPSDAVKGSPPWDRSKPAGQREIQTAVTDMNCKTQVNYVGIMGAIRHAYEQQTVEQHAEELRNIRKNLDLVIRNTAKTLGGKNST